MLQEPTLSHRSGQCEKYGSPPLKDDDVHKEEEVQKQVPVQ